MRGTQFGPVVLPGDALTKVLVMLIEGRVDPTLKMPHGDAPAPTPQEVLVIRRWVEQGVDANDLNKRMMESAMALNAMMFDWDLTAWIPGWTGIFVLDNPATDLYNMKGAIAALRAGDGETALDMLTDVTTMKWGRFVDYSAYLGVMEYIYYIPEDHQLWGGGFLPPHSDVHEEYFSIMEKVESGSLDFSAEIASLEQLVLELYGDIDVISDELGLALHAAADALSEA